MNPLQTQDLMMPETDSAETQPATTLSVAPATQITEAAPTSASSGPESSSVRQRLGQSWSLWLAGVGPSVAERCTDAEHRKLGAIGYTVLVPPVLGLLAAGYATSLLTSNRFLIALIALGWAFIVLTIDRGIVATFRESLSLGAKRRQFILRLAIAGLMALTISHPLTLLVFKDTVQREVERTIQEGAERESRVVEENIDGLQKQIAAIQAQMDIPASQKFGAGMAAETPADAAVRTRMETLRAEARSNAEERAATHAQLRRAEEEYANEVNGNRESGLRGEGPIARNIKDTRIVPLQGTLQALTIEENRLRGIIEAATRELAQVQAEDRARNAVERDQFLAEQSRQRQVWETEQAKLRAEVDRLREKQHEIERKTEEGIAAMQPGAPDRVQPDLLAQTMALHGLFEDRERGGHFAFVAFVSLMLLFFAVDAMPILLKFSTKRGEYDERIDFHHEVVKRESERELAEQYPEPVRPAPEGEAVFSEPNADGEALVDGIEEPVHSRIAPINVDQPVMKPQRKWLTWLTGQTFNLAIGAIGLSLLLQPEPFRIPYADAAADRYMSEATAKAAVSYGICRLVNAAVSVFKESEITLGIFGMGVQVAAGQILDPIDKLVERASDIFITALASLFIQQVVYDLSVQVSPFLCGIVLLGIVFTGIAGGRAFPSLRRQLLLALLVIVFVRCVVPVSALLSEAIDSLHFDQKIEKLNADLPLSQYSLADLKDLDKVKEMADDLWNGEERLTNYLIDASSIAIAKFLLEVIIFPLGFFLILTRVSHLLLGWRWPVIIRQKEIVEHLNRPQVPDDPKTTPEPKL